MKSTTSIAAVGALTGVLLASAARAQTDFVGDWDQAGGGIFNFQEEFIDRGGGFSFAVAIRTALVHAGEVDARGSAREQKVTYFAGGGIVVDSDPERETRETDLKAQVFLQALGQSDVR